MKTYEIMNPEFAKRRPGAVYPDGEAPEGFSFAASPLPVFGNSFTSKPAGIALAFANADADRCGEDRFMLHVVDADGEVLGRLGPFTDEDIVATWRDCALKSGLPRMILREDGCLGTVSRQCGRVVLGQTRQRRRHGSLSGRRPRFLVRRKTARLPSRPLIYRNEKEIIARS